MVVVSDPAQPDVKYELGAVIDGGEYGTVYRGSETGGSCRSVAIKVFDAQSAHDSDFRREVQALQDVASRPPSDKRHLVRLLASFTHPGVGRCVVLYPLCKESLAGRLASSPSGGYDLSKALTWLFQMAHGLRDLMRAATIHGDLHPGNVLLSEYDQVVLVDFNISTRDHPYGSCTSMLPSKVNGGFFTAPELASDGSHQVDSRCDLFSLGMLGLVLLSRDALQLLGPPHPNPNNHHHAHHHGGNGPHRQQQALRTALQDGDTAAIGALVRQAIQAGQLVPPSEQGEVGRLLASLLHPDPRRRPLSWHVMVGLQRLLWAHGGPAARPLLHREVYQGAGKGPRMAVVEQARASSDLHVLLEALALNALEGQGRGEGQVLQDCGDEARLCEAFGMRGRAVELYETLVQRMRDSGHDKLWVGLNDLAMARYDDGRADEALPAYEEAIELRLAHAPPHEPPSYEVLMLRVNLANALSSLNRHAQARPHYDAALSYFQARGLQSLSPQEGHGLASTLLNAGGCCFALKDDGSSEQHYRQLQSLLPATHPFLPQVLTGLASLCGRRGQWAQAVHLHRTTVDGLPADHAGLPQALNQLALAHTHNGDLSSALAVTQELLRLREQTLAPTHADVLASLCNLADVLGSLHRWPDAVHRYRDAEERMRTSGEAERRPQRMMLCLVGLGRAHAQVGDHSASLQCYNEAVDCYSKGGGAPGAQQHVELLRERDAAMTRVAASPKP